MVHHHSHRHGLMSYYINSFHMRLKAKRNKQKAPREAVFFFFSFLFQFKQFYYGFVLSAKMCVHFID